MLGKTNILSSIDAGYSLSIKKYNEFVDKNRHTLSRVIDYIKFCGVHELPLRGHDETIDSNNRGDRTAMGLQNVFKEELNCFCQKEKLIAQAYDGAAIMRRSRNGVQSLMKEVYPNAHYVHCYAHQLNLVLKKVCSSNKQIPKVCETRWNFRSKIVTCIKENKTKIGECFNKIINDEGWDDTSVWQSVGFKKCLEDLELKFFLSFFYSILKHVDVLYNILQSSKSNTITIKEAFEKFELSINFVRNSITDNVSGSILNNCEEMHENRMNRKTSIELLIEDAKDACDKVIYEISDRFRSIEIFNSFSYLDPKNFKFNRQHFPRNHIKNILTNYPMLSEVKLMSELTVLYENAVFSDIGTLSQFMHENNLIETFSAISKLIEIVLVTPVSTADAERCISTLKRVKTLLRNSTGQDRLNALAVLSMNKDHLQDIDQFNQKVIEMFSLKKQRRAVYLYK
ncbi:uncharacterized protein LOC136075892 [Hydra vulgaris]|uniref:Uncharacterized protein LOC136075892 n=1 Tax=Hydra vulgaris TaxID=6087 RepID=A0ABM4B945_HYDVU